jgi:uncharacterized protein (DUF488 family)
VSGARTVATIGYEATTLDAVLTALEAAGVVHLLDIRAVPQSRKPGFSRRLLAASVEARGLRYTHLRGLGTPKAGRDAVRRGDVPTMETIFSEHMLSDPAQADLARAVAIAGEAPVCLLCFEREHARCHRRIVAEMIVEKTGQTVRHLSARSVSGIG